MYDPGSVQAANECQRYCSHDEGDWAANVRRIRCPTAPQYREKPTLLNPKYACFK